MSVHLHVWFTNSPDDPLAVALSQLSSQIGAMKMALDALQAAVTAEDTVIDSAIALLQGLAAQVAALQPDQAAIDALAKDITDKTTALAGAVTANTPAGMPAAPAMPPASA